MKCERILILTIISLFTQVENTWSQSKKTAFAPNNLGATYHNFLQIGKINTSIVDEYAIQNVGSDLDGLHEVATFVMPFFGARVTNSAGNRITVFDWPNLRTHSNGTRDVLTPVSGFSSGAENPFGIARSSEPATWPAKWPHKMNDASDPGWAGSWPGYFGKNKFFAADELFFRVTDSLATRYSSVGTYVPVAGNPTRGGIGLEMDVHVFGFPDKPEFEGLANLHFVVMDVKNVSDKTIDSVGVGLWIADLIAKTSTDDMAEMAGENLIVSESLQRGAFFGVRLLETPLTSGSFSGLTQVSSVRAGVLRVDQDVQNKPYLDPKTRINWIVNGVIGEDQDRIMSSAWFSVEKGASFRFAFCFGIGKEKSTLISSLELAARSYNDGFRDQIGFGEQTQRREFPRIIQVNLSAIPMESNFNPFKHVKRVFGRFTSESVERMIDFQKIDSTNYRLISSQTQERIGKTEDVLFGYEKTSGEIVYEPLLISNDAEKTIWVPREDGKSRHELVVDNAFISTNPVSKASDFLYYVPFDIQFGEVGFGQSSGKTFNYLGSKSFPSVATNFKIIDRNSNKELEYALLNNTQTEAGKFDAKWVIGFFGGSTQSDLVYVFVRPDSVGYVIRYRSETFKANLDKGFVLPSSGDVFNYRLKASERIVEHLNDFIPRRTDLTFRAPIIPFTVRNENSPSPIPGSFTLGNFPNPFNPSTTVRFQLPEAGNATLRLFDLTGRLIGTMLSKPMSAGTHSFQLDAHSLSSGVYIVKLDFNAQSITRKIVLVK